MQMNLSAEDAAMLWNDVVGMAHDTGNAALIPWIERLAPVSLQDGTMTVSTRQNWTAKRIMGEFRPDIEALLTEITLEPIALSVIVDAPAIVPRETSTDAAESGESAATVRQQPVAPVPIQQPAEVAAVATAVPDPVEQPTAKPSAAALIGAAAANRTRMLGGPTSATTYVPGMSPAQLAAQEVLAAQRAQSEQAATTAEDPAPAPAVATAHVHTIEDSAMPPVIDTHPTTDNTSCISAAMLGETAAAPASDSDASVPILGDGVMPASVVSTRFTDFSFDTLIVGDANTIAYNMALSVAEQPGSVPNPLFIWGPSGNGKTHLLLSILNYIDEHQHALTARYVASNTFIEQYVDDIRVKKLKGSEVLREYRDIDVLLVDDVQFFEDKQQSATSFFDIFNQLILDGKQIVLAADTPPDYLSLDDRMRTRFGMGLVVDIKAPNYEMKRAILKSFYERCKARTQWNKVEIPDALFDVIAQAAPDNPRTMQGLIQSLIMRAGSDPAVLTPTGIKTVVNELFKSTEAVSMASIMRAVGDAYGVTVEDLQSKSRSRNVSEARHVVTWMARQLTDDSYESIGEALGGRDHSTVYYGIGKVNERIEKDKAYFYKLDRLRKEITG